MACMNSSPDITRATDQSFASSDTSPSRSLQIHRERKIPELFQIEKHEAHGLRLRQIIDISRSAKKGRGDKLKICSHFSRARYAAFTRSSPTVRPFFNLVSMLESWSSDDAPLFVVENKINRTIE